MGRPERAGNLVSVWLERGAGLADMEYARTDDSNPGVVARNRHRRHVADVVRIGEGEPESLRASRASRRRAGSPFSPCPAAGKRDVAGPGVAGPASTHDETHARDIAFTAEYDRHRRTPRQRPARGVLRSGKAPAHPFDAHHHGARIPRPAGRNVAAGPDSPGVARPVRFVWNKTVPRPSTAPAGGGRAGGRRSTVPSTTRCRHGHAGPKAARYDAFAGAALPPDTTHP